MKTEIRKTFEKIRDVLEGWFNMLFRRRYMAELARARLTECNGCEFKKLKTNTCGICGCFLPAKARVFRQKCPEGKWER